MDDGGFGFSAYMLLACVVVWAVESRKGEERMRGKDEAGAGAIILLGSSEIWKYSPQLNGEY